MRIDIIMPLLQPNSHTQLRILQAPFPTMMEMEAYGSTSGTHEESVDVIFEQDTEKNLRNAFNEFTFRRPIKRFLTKLNQMCIKTMNHELLRKIYVEDCSIRRFLNGLISRSVTYVDGKDERERRKKCFDHQCQ